MKKLTIILALALFTVFIYGAYNVTPTNKTATEKFDDKPKKAVENKDDKTAQESTTKEEPKKEQNGEVKKECSETKTECNKEQKSSCCKK